MRVISGEERELFDQLAELAGSPLLVEEILKKLAHKLDRPPRLEEVVDEILRQRKRVEAKPPAAAGAP
jgi:hypothetical protein